MIGRIFIGNALACRHACHFEWLAWYPPDREYWHCDFTKRSKGRCSGEGARLPPVWPRFKSQRRLHMWVEFVVGSLLCFERFFSGYSGFPLSSKTNSYKFHLDQESGRRRITLWRCYLQIIVYLLLFIYLRGFHCIPKMFIMSSSISREQGRSGHFFLSWTTVPVFCKLSSCSKGIWGQKVKVRVWYGRGILCSHIGAK